MKRFFSFFALIALTAATCPADWFSDGDDMCLKIFTDLSTEPDAAASCKALGGSLAMIKNAFTEVTLYSQPSTSNVVWIGIICKGNKITNCYYEDGEQLTATSYSNFYPGYPDANKGSCTYMVLNGASAGKWYNIDCNALPFAYACQRADKTFSGCPTDYATKDDSCYKVLTDALSYTDAELACNAKCGHIVTIDSNEENNFVMNLARDSSDTSSFTRIASIYNGHEYCNPCGDNCCNALSYSNFGHSNPDLGECVGMALNANVLPEGKWINTYCEKPMLTVCESPAGSFPCNSPIGPSPSPTPSYTSCENPMFFDGNGTISSLPPGWRTSCTFIISVAKGSLASIVFSTYSLDASSTFELYNDILDKTPFKTLRYNDKVISQVYNSQEESMKVVFTSSANSVNTWTFKYGPRSNNIDPTPSTLGSGCNAGLLSAPGTITSPLYPQYYPDNTDCTYQLTAGNGKRVFINFSDVRTESWDIIDIYDGSTTKDTRIGSLSGFFPPKTNFTSSGPNMLVTFVSDSQVSYNGFAATFIAV